MGRRRVESARWTPDVVGVAPASDRGAGREGEDTRPTRESIRSWEAPGCSRAGELLGGLPSASRSVGRYDLPDDYPYSPPAHTASGTAACLLLPLEIATLGGVKPQPGPVG